MQTDQIKLRTSKIRDGPFLYTSISIETLFFYFTEGIALCFCTVHCDTIM